MPPNQCYSWLYFVCGLQGGFEELGYMVHSAAPFSAPSGQAGHSPSCQRWPLKILSEISNFESARIWPFLSMGNASVIVKNQNKAPCSLCSCFFLYQRCKSNPLECTYG